MTSPVHPDATIASRRIVQTGYSPSRWKAPEPSGVKPGPAELIPFIPGYGMTAHRIRMVVAGPVLGVGTKVRLGVFGLICS